jgi:hypothetical protein
MRRRPGTEELADEALSPCFKQGGSVQPATPRSPHHNLRWRSGHRAVLLCICILQLATAFARPAATDAFQRGTNAYAMGDYTTAAKAFSEAAQIQPASGTFQNLGIAEWLRGRRGFAVLAWEQSVWVDPFNKASRENLRFARREGQLESPELAWYEAASTWLPVNTWAVLAGLSLWLTIAMLMLPRILNLRRAIWHQALAVAGCALFLLCLPSLVGISTRSRIGIVLESAPLRLTPTDNGQTLLELAAGEPARIERTRKNYLLIRTSFGRGWIQRAQLGRICPE